MVSGSNLLAGGSSPITWQPFRRVRHLDERDGLLAEHCLAWHWANSLGCGSCLVDPGRDVACLERPRVSLNEAGMPGCPGGMPSAESTPGEEGWSSLRFEGIYWNAYPSLVRLAAYLHPDGDAAAEDAVQEAYVRVLSKRPELGEPERLLAYLRVAVVNLCRGAGRRRGVVNRYLAGLGRSEAHRCDDHRDGPALDGPFTRHELVVALRSLPRRQQEVVVLRYYAGFSESETATTLGINPGTVKSSGARGLSALAKKLGVEP